MNEGSVVTDGVESDFDESEQINNQEDNQDGESQEQGNQGDGANQNQDGEGDKGEQRTDKGTKLDPNPMSALNQRAANAERAAKEYESLLSDPKKVKAYLAELEAEVGGEEASGDKKPRIDPKDIKTREDLQRFAEQLQADSKNEIEKVVKGLQGMQGQRAMEKTQETIISETRAVQEQYPALREKNADGSNNPDFDPNLDKLVGEFFLAFNYDQKTDTMRNNVPMSAVAKTVMDAYQLGQKLGSNRTNTQIIDRRSGRTKSGQGGNGGGQPDETNLSASQIIANRIKRVAGQGQRR